MSLHTFPPLRATRLSCLRGILGTSLISFSRRIVPIRRRAISVEERKVVRARSHNDRQNLFQIPFLSLSPSASGSFLRVNSERVVRWCGPSWLSALHTFQPDKRSETVSTTYAYSASLLKIVPVLAATSLLNLFSNESRAGGSMIASVGGSSK